MKTKLYFPFILCFLSSSYLHVNAQTNTYHPFPDSNAVWRIYYYTTQPDHQYTLRYRMQGDTLIGSKLYKKIFMDPSYWDPFVLGINLVTLTYYGGYIGGLRDDTIGRKVFFVFRDSVNEMLLYDFSLQPGDTMKGILSSQNLSSHPYFIVEKIDSVLLNNGEYHRMLRAKDMGDDIIEGVGGTAGLFKVLGPENYNELLCFKVNDSILYPDDVWQNLVWNCDSPVSVIGKPPVRDKVSIFPNPTDGRFTIEFSEDIPLKGITVQCYNTLGECQELFNRRNGRQLLLETICPPGMYLIRIQLQGLLPRVKKLIISP